MCTALTASGRTVFSAHRMSTPPALFGNTRAPGFIGRGSRARMARTGSPEDVNCVGAHLHTGESYTTRRGRARSTSSDPSDPLLGAAQRRLAHDGDVPSARPSRVRIPALPYG